MDRPFFLLLLFFVGALFFSCDRLDEDLAPTLDAGGSNRHLYASPGGASVFKVESLYTSTLPFSIQIMTAPQKGELQINPHGFLLYKPYASFQSGRDKIIYSVLQNGSRVAQDSLFILMPTAGENYPCSAGAMSDSLWVQPNSAASALDVLANDVYCNADALTLTLEVAPTHGQLELVNEQFLYTPTHGFVGQDYFIYKLCQQLPNSNGTATASSCTYAYVHLQIRETPGILCTFSSLPDQFVLPPDTATNATEYLALDILANDNLCGHSPASVTLSPPEHGKAYYSNQRMYYQRKKDYIGTDKLYYTSCDAEGNCSESLVTIVCN